MPRSRTSALPAKKAASIIIRPLRRGDGRAFLDLVNALADFEHLRRPDAAARRRLLRDAAGGRRRFNALLLFADRAPVGYAIFFETYSSFLARPTLFLEDIFIHPAHRNRGYGERLFHHCLKEARRRRCGRMEWIVLDWNKGAMRFYDRLGARAMHEWRLYRITL